MDILSTKCPIQLPTEIIYMILQYAPCMDITADRIKKEVSSWTRIKFIFRCLLTLSENNLYHRHHLYKIDSKKELHHSFFRFEPFDECWYRIASRPGLVEPYKVLLMIHKTGKFIMEHGYGIELSSTSMDLHTLVENTRITRISPNIMMN